MTFGRRHHPCGFSLVEVVVSMAILSVLLIATIDTVGATARSQKLHADQTRAHLLAQDLMDEILQQHFEEPEEVVVFGPEASETGGGRAAFDDIDDYDGWNAEPQSKDGTPFPGLDGWVCSVTVEFANPDALNAAGSSSQGVKRIAVRVVRDGRSLANVVMIVTETWVGPPYE